MTSLVSGRIPAGAFVPDAIEVALVDALERAEEREAQARRMVENFGGPGSEASHEAAKRTASMARDRLRAHRVAQQITEGVRLG